DSPEALSVVLENALRRGDQEAALEAIESGAEISSSCLLAAAESGSYDCMKVALRRTWTKEQLQQALAVAFASGNMDSVTMLYYLGATDLKDALPHAIRSRRYDAIKCVLKQCLYDATNFDVAEAVAF